MAVKLSKELAERVKAATIIVEGTSKAGGNVEGITANPRRQARYYRTTETAIPAPTSPDEPASAMCTLMKFDGTELIETATIEKVWSTFAIPMDTTFQAHQIGGRIFALELSAGVCQLFVVEVAPAFDECDIPFVLGRRVQWDLEECETSNPDPQETLYLPWCAPMLNHIPEFPVEVGDQVWAQMVPTFGNRWVIKEFGYTGVRVVTADSRCTAEGTELVKERWHFKAGRLMYIEEDETLTCEGCCKEECCSDQISMTEPSCDDPPPTCSPIPCQASELVFCLEAFTFNELTGDWAVTVKNREDIVLGDGGFGGFEWCLGMVVQGACSLGTGSILSISPEEGSEFTPLSDDEHIVCAWALTGAGGLYEPGDTVPGGTEVTITGETNFNEIVPCECCTFTLQIYMLFDGPNAAGFLIAEVEYGECPCVPGPCDVTACIP